MFKVYGRPHCSYCSMATELLEGRREEYIYIDVMQDAESLQMLKDNGFKTVPQIWKEGAYIGGFNNLTEHFNNLAVSGTADIDGE